MTASNAMITSSVTKQKKKNLDVSSCNVIVFYLLTLLKESPSSVTSQHLSSVRLHKVVAIKQWVCGYTNTEWWKQSTLVAHTSLGLLVRKSVPTPFWPCCCVAAEWLKSERYVKLFWGREPKSGLGFKIHLSMCQEGRRENGIKGKVRTRVAVC